MDGLSGRQKPCGTTELRADPRGLISQRVDGHSAPNEDGPTYLLLPNIC